MKIFFISNIEGLQISSDLGKGEKVGDVLFITNNKNYIKSLLSETFRKAIGELETGYLEKANSIAYSIEEYSGFPNQDDAYNYLLERISYLKMLLQMLWLIKDNAVNVDFGFLEYPARIMETCIVRHSISNSFITSAGEKIDAVFSRDEFRNARSFYQSYVGVINRDAQILSQQKITRLERALYFSQHARDSTDLGIKITNYCTTFESLFSSDSHELSHKLAERIACFLGSDFEERIKIYQEIKRAYNIRSKVIHGAFGSVTSDLDTVSISCDNILRKAIKKILNEPEQFKYFREERTNEEMEKYFLSLVLKNHA